MTVSNLLFPAGHMATPGSLKTRLCSTRVHTQRITPSQSSAPHGLSHYHRCTSSLQQVRLPRTTQLLPTPARPRQHHRKYTMKGTAMAKKNAAEAGVPDTANQPPASPVKVIAAVSIGNLLEWYDNGIYAILSVYIAQAFFPSGNPGVGLLLTFGAMATGYLFRPIGALVIGTYADRVGRKPALILTLNLMGTGTLMMAIIPSYSTIGIWAPILVLLSRFIQGFSAGGEFGSATALMMEHLPNRRGLAASFNFASQGLSHILSSGVGLILALTLSAEQISDWGIRVAFALGAVIIPVAAYLRRSVPESPEFIKVRDSRASEAKHESMWAPIKYLFRWHLPVMLLLIVIIGNSGAMNYLLNYIPTYSINSLGLPAYVGFTAVMISGFCQTFLMPLSGLISDHVGKARQMLIGAIVVAVAVWPLFGLLNAFTSVALLITVVISYQVLSSWYGGPLGGLQGALFPTEVRGLGLAFTYSCGIAIFGGLTPFMTQLLINTTGQKTAPAYWAMFVAALAATCLAIVIHKYRPDTPAQVTDRPDEGH